MPISLFESMPAVIPVASVPTPERFRINGEPVTLLGIVTDPVNVPVAVGLNTTVKVVVPEAAIDAEG